MTYIYRLAGENMELAEAELNGFLESQNIDEKASRTGKLAETRNHPSQLKRLALTHEVSRKISEASKSDELEIDIDFSGSFSVRAENISQQETDTRELESKIGQRISNEDREVDLENPEKEFKAYVLKDKVVLAEKVMEIDRGLFRKRKNDERPFSSPVSMDPVLARVLVNLSGVKPGEHLLDPFCGTGGILIEAGLCGIGVHGRDISEKMIAGTRENLETYGIITHDLECREVSELEKIGDYSVIVCDLPYGKASETTDDAVTSFINLVEDFNGKTVFMYNQPSIGSLEADHSIYVHGSLTRYIFTV